jgi:nucleotide-binding universal stress UspA family protein
MFKKILHANDGSDHAFNALSLALQIAKHDKAEPVTASQRTILCKVARNSVNRRCPIETALPGWACEIRTQKCRGKLSL